MSPFLSACLRITRRTCLLYVICVYFRVSTLESLQKQLNVKFHFIDRLDSRRILISNFTTTQTSNNQQSHTYIYYYNAIIIKYAYSPKLSFVTVVSTFTATRKRPVKSDKSSVWSSVWISIF